MLKNIAIAAVGATIGVAGTILYRKYGPDEIVMPAWMTRATNRTAAA